MVIKPKAINYDKNHDVIRVIMPNPEPPFILDTEEIFPDVYASKIEQLLEVTIFDYALRSKRELSLLVPEVDWDNVREREPKIGINRKEL